MPINEELIKEIESHKVGLSGRLLGWMSGADRVVNTHEYARGWVDGLSRAELETYLEEYVLSQHLRLRPERFDKEDVIRAEFREKIRAIPDERLRDQLSTVLGVKLSRVTPVGAGSAAATVALLWIGGMLKNTTREEKPAEDGGYSPR